MRHKPFEVLIARSQLMSSFEKSQTKKKTKRTSRMECYFRVTPEQSQRLVRWTWSGVSDEAPADFQKEILGISMRLLHDPRIVAMFECRLLKYKFHSVLGFISFHYEFPSKLCESGISIPSYFLFQRRKAGLGLALVLTKLRSG
jgi:hypothetical protein